MKQKLISYTDTRILSCREHRRIRNVAGCEGRDPAVSADLSHESRVSQHCIEYSSAAFTPTQLKGNQLHVSAPAA